VSCDLSAAPGQLENLAGVLGDALATWRTRDVSKARPGVRQAANTALAAIDDMLAGLHRVRQQLVSEVRAYDDAAGARVDAMLAEARARREAGQ
jgi:hypothetical protein